MSLFPHHTRVVSDESVTFYSPILSTRRHPVLSVVPAETFENIYSTGSYENCPATSLTCSTYDTPYTDASRRKTPR